jgi:hypothetical protein
MPFSSAYGVAAGSIGSIGSANQKTAGIVIDAIERYQR